MSENKIPILQEELSVGKKTVGTGRVEVSTITDFVEDIARADLESSKVEVTRVPIDREVESVPEIRTVGNVTIIPVVEEKLVVERRLVLREELHITRHTTVEAVEVPVTLRKQRAEISRQTYD